MISNPNIVNPLKPEDYSSEVFPTWCPGCGNFAIWAALKNALSELKLPPHRVALSFGIGCSGNFNNFVRANVFHSLHGRALPAAMGIKLGNHELTVIAMGGDGDGFAEGLGHTLETIRSNVNLTYIVHDNHMYSLTTGQTSPTTALGAKTKTAPLGAYEYPLNPLALALSAGGSFVARGFAGDIPHLQSLIAEGVSHRGFSFIDVMQPCPTFNPEMSYDWYRGRVYRLDEAGYVPDNRFRAWEVAQAPLDKKIAIGVLYKEDRSILEDNFPELSKTPLVKRDLNKLDIRPLFDNFK
ncbi:MAG: 2-oxoacid:ferredoxin oxidoreductase subunit beta [Patescibacteria group bacterium]|nr:2-oxoacid:ferredoxin oxidoreductase subunit beta [Patescibacteria group bacterium]